MLKLPNDDDDYDNDDDNDDDDDDVDDDDDDDDDGDDDDDEWRLWFGSLTIPQVVLPEACSLYPFSYWVANFRGTELYLSKFSGYVVRWKYCVKLTGVKTLKGKQSKYEDVGRDKVAYFFWQGKDSTLNEKGTAALMTVELDSDKGPQVGY